MATEKRKQVFDDPNSEQCQKTSKKNQEDAMTLIRSGCDFILIVDNTVEKKISVTSSFSSDRMQFVMANYAIKCGHDLIKDITMEYKNG